MKNLLFVEILFAVFIASTAYCAKMPPGRIPEEKQQLQKKQTDSKKTQNKNQKDLTNQSKNIEIGQNALQGGTVGAFGIGEKQLVQGLHEQDVDTKTDEKMTAYIKTFHCSYANGNFVNGGAEPIELPGGNDETFIKLRDEYFALATDLKERKEALGMAPGLETEIIQNKATLGLYDDENIGINDGVYGSIYRAQMGNESDKTKINEEQEKSAEHVKGGISAIVTGIVTSIGINTNTNQTKEIKPKEKNKNDKKTNEQNSKKTQTKQKEKK